LSAEGFGTGSTPESKPATNRGEADRDLDRGLELLLAVLLAMGHPGASVLALMTQEQRNRVVDRLIADASARLIAATRLLMGQKIAFRVWLIQMRDILVGSLAAGTLAVVGREGLSDAEKDSWVSEVNLQYGYLVNWYAELREGRQHLNQAMVARSDLYARAIWSVGWRVWVAGKMGDVVLPGGQIKKPWGKRFLGAAEHCPDCIEWAGLPWLPLEEVPPIGSSVCGPRCHCTIEVEWRLTS
jgi:hypothetical protein